MSLTSAYEAFLGFPSATHLSEDASLNYITTLTTVNGSAAIAKHLSQQQKIVRKKHEKLLGTVEANTALCVDVETTLEFITGGGAYLPGLDDNFLADHVVTFPMVSARDLLSDGESNHDCRCISYISTTTARSSRSACTGTRAHS